MYMKVLDRENQAANAREPEIVRLRAAQRAISWWRGLASTAIGNHFFMSMLRMGVCISRFPLWYNGLGSLLPDARG